MSGGRIRQLSRSSYEQKGDKSSNQGGTTMEEFRRAIWCPMRGFKLLVKVSV